MTCDIKRCKQPRVLGYVVDDITYGVCQVHWNKHSDDMDNFNLKKSLTEQIDNKGGKSVVRTFSPSKAGAPLSAPNNLDKSGDTPHGLTADSRGEVKTAGRVTTKVIQQGSRGDSGCDCPPSVFNTLENK